MKELKKILNKTTDAIYNFLEKISKAINKKDNAHVIKTIIKVIILFLLYMVLGWVTDGIVSIGKSIIYQVGMTGRSLLSSIWTVVVNFTYFLFVVVSLYRLTEVAQKDKEFITLSKDSKKDRNAKKRVFLTIENVIKVLGTIILIPIFVLDIAMIFVLGIMVGYLRQSIYLIGLFIIAIGLILFFTGIIFLIKTLLSPWKDTFKKYVYVVILAGILLAGGSITILFETQDYKTVDALTSDFTNSTFEYQYKMYKGLDYVITNNGKDSYMNLVVDDDLGSYLEIIILHATTNEVKTNIKQIDNKLKIGYEEELNLGVNDLEKLLNFGVSCIKEKTIYNYNLLKYAKIEVHVSSEYAKQIKFVGANGKEYSPYERNN